MAAAAAAHAPDSDRSTLRARPSRRSAPSDGLSGDVFSGDPGPASPASASASASASGKPDDPQEALLTPPPSTTKRARRPSIAEAVSQAVSGAVASVSHAVSQAADDLCHSRAWYATLHFDDLSDWRRDNNAIYRGYRQIQRSYHGCTWSLFYFHNETVNVYTHLVGCLLFVGFAVALVMDHLRNIAAIDAAAPSPTGPHASGLARSLDVVITLVFLAGAIICLGLSGLFHLFCCHSREVSQAWNRCDYVGIVALIVFSYFPPVYWAFLCQPMLQLLYLGTIVVFGIGTMVAVMNARLATPAYRWLRTGLFSMLGLAGIVPVLHSTLRFGLPFTRHALGFDDLLLMGAMYLTGAVIYAARWPECIWPGRFDLVGHSHQIFHCLVVAAALVHYRCAIHLQTYWQGIVATTPGLCAIPPAQLAAQALSHPADLPS